MVPTLTPDLCTRLADYLAGRGCDDWVFPLRDPAHFRCRTWAKAVGKADLTAPSPTPHALRHTAVALWLAAGRSLYEASRWAGHASVATTEQVYGHLLEPDGSVGETLQELLAGSAEVVQLRGRALHQAT